MLKNQWEERRSRGRNVPRTALRRKRGHEGSSLFRAAHHGYSRYALGTMWLRMIRLRLFGVLRRMRMATIEPALDWHWNVNGRFLPARLPLRAWAVAAPLFLLTYIFMWSFVHVRIDQRPCTFTLEDPLFELVPFDGRWFWVTHQLYAFATLSVLGAFIVTALLGDHRPLVTWGTALAFEAILRSITMLLMPLCRITEAVGTRALLGPPAQLNLGFTTIPWRVWAVNDLVFSGHVGEFLLIYWLTPHWPRPLRAAIGAFLLLQSYALIATRGHYTIDIVLALPCALFEFRLALRMLVALAAPLRKAQSSEQFQLDDSGVIVNGIAE